MNLHEYGQLVDSAKINEKMWVVKDEAYRAKFISEGAEYPIFTWAEVEHLKGKGVTSDAMKKIWTIRKVFPGSEITNIFIAQEV